MRPIVHQNRKKIKTSVRFFRYFRRGLGLRLPFGEIQIAPVQIVSAAAQDRQIGIVDDHIICIHRVLGIHRKSGPQLPFARIVCRSFPGRLHDSSR